MPTSVKPIFDKACIEVFEQANHQLDIYAAICYCWSYRVFRKLYFSAYQETDA